jgi:hypothetical protein
MKLRTFWMAFFITTAWINASEVFRYVVIVMPSIRAELAGVPDVAPMNLFPVFTIWGAWDTLLTLTLMWMTWLCQRHFANKLQLVLVAGTAMWASFFVLFWVAMVNMNLSSIGLALTALPLAWLEMVLAAWLAQWSYVRFGGPSDERSSSSLGL